MARAPATSPAWLLAAALAGGLVAMASGPLRDPLRVAEARTIYVGREVLARGLPSCRGAPADSLAALACAAPGSAALAPVAIALADAAGGLVAARALGILLGLAVVVLVARTAASPSAGGRGPMAAAIFLALGLPWPLAAAALPRIHAAALLATAVLLIEGPATWRPVLRHALAGATLALAAMASYAMAIFALPLALLVLARRGRSLASLGFVVTLLAALAAYALLAIGPASGQLLAGFQPAWAASSPAGVVPRIGPMVDWLSMAFLLSTFGLFHAEGPGRAARLLAVAACGFAVPLLTTRAEEQQAAALAALVLLAPAAALGVERMVELLSASGGVTGLRPAFSAAVLLVVAAFGLQQSRDFRRAEPDLSAAVALLLERGWPGMTVAADSDHGSPEYLYRYQLERGGTQARVVGITRASEAERQAQLASLRPDWVVLDQHHSPRSLELATAQYQAAGYAAAGSWPVARARAGGSLRVFARERRSSP